MGLVFASQLIARLFRRLEEMPTVMPSDKLVPTCETPSFYYLMSFSFTNKTGEKEEDEC